MAAVAPATPTHVSSSVSPNQRLPSSTQHASLKRMTSRKLFGRSRRPTPPPPSSELDSAPHSAVDLASHASHGDPSSASNGTASSYADEKVFSSRNNNVSTSALSATSTASRTSRFFRRFGRQKPPPVPSLPPALVLDLDAGTAVPRSAGVITPPYSSGNGEAFDFKQRQQHRQPQPAPSAAAAIIAQSNAAYAAAETVPKPKGLQRKKMLEALTNARLDVSQARDLVRMCGLHIRERGLDTSGLFRPFRIAESRDHVYHMIQLFLLSIDVSTYIAVFPILPENALDRFGRNTTSTAGTSSNEAKSKVAREELDKELRYAAPHDVVSVMKWGLRHMRLRTSDFNSKDADEWYDVFVASERASAYHARAIADLLHPKLPHATAELLSEVLDLMASVAAHSSSNHMPASALCKVLGFWLFGRIGVAHPPPTVDELIEAVNRTSAMAEHLLLAHIRSQAAVTFSMPLRLTELVERYPYVKPGAEAPCLPPAFASRPVSTLRIDLRSDNLVVSQAKPRSPSSTLAAALEATASDDLKGDQADIWAAITTRVDAEASNKGYELLIDEHVRILRQVDQQLLDGNEESSAEEGASSTLMTAAPTAAAPVAAPSIAQLKAQRRRSQSLSDLRTNFDIASNAPNAPLEPLAESRTSTDTPRASNTPKRKPVPVFEPQEFISDAAEHDSQLFSGELEPSASWRSFSEEGFGALSSASSELSLSQFDLKPVTMPRSRSGRSVYRRTSRPMRLKVVQDPEAGRTKPLHTLTRATTVDLDASFAIVWQDQLLDPSPCCRLPQLVFVQLKSSPHNQIPTYPTDTPWLLIAESIIPPRPPTPPSTHRPDDPDRRSIFAPSIRSVRLRLRRVSTVIGSGIRRKGALPAEADGVEQVGV